MESPTLTYASRPHPSRLRITCTILLAVWGTLFLLASLLLLGMCIYSVLQPKPLSPSRVDLDCVLIIPAVPFGAIGISLLRRAVHILRQSRPLTDFLGITFMLFAAGSIVYVLIVLAIGDIREYSILACSLTLTPILATTGVLLHRLNKQEAAAANLSPTHSPSPHQLPTPNPAPSPTPVAPD